MRTAARLKRIPPYLFAELDRKQQEAAQRGIDLINLGVGDPDQPTPEAVIDVLCTEARKPENHRYPSYVGHTALRTAAAQWMQQRFGVEVDPDTEVIALIGSKEGIAHTCWAFVDSGDYTLVPDPAYPVYANQTLLAGGTPYPMPLRPENGFLPDLEAIPQAVLEQTTVMFLNYPNNPTAAVAELEFFERAVALARRYNFLLCHDAAYIDLTFDGYRASSILEIPGAKEVALEFHSLSKPFNMTGWRIGFAVGNAQAVGALGKIKTNTDSGQFTAIQFAAVEALLRTPTAFREKMASLYRARRDAAVAGLRSLGFEVEPPRGTFYLWVPVPQGWNSLDFAEHLLTTAGVVVSPGAAFGQQGEGFFRLALTTGEERIREAVRRIGRALEVGR